MKTELIALDPTVERNPISDRFFQVLHLFQSKQILHPAAVASVVHPSLYAVPSMAYRELKGRFVKEANQRIEQVCRGLFDLGPIHILASDTSAKERHVEQLVRCAKRLGIDALILASNDRVGLPYWFLGSFSEMAALTAKIPVFIIKPSLDESDLAREVRFMLAIDAASPPTANEIRWIAKLAKPSHARVDLVYVEAKKRPVVDSFQLRKKSDEAENILKKIEAALQSNGVRTQKKILQESSQSVAHTICEYADHAKVWLTITTTPERSEARKLFLGSTARKVLTLTKRPFLSLRLH